MLGHLTVDTYVGVIPVLYPLLIGRFQLSLATVGLVSLAYGGMAAISQPLFGVIADRFGTRLTGVALGIQGTGLLIIPGLVTGAYLLWRMRSALPPAARQRGLAAAGQAAPVFALAI